MIDVQAIITKALLAERTRIGVIREEKTALLSRLMGQRDELTTTILNLTSQIADVDADLSTIDAAAVTPKP